MPIRRSMPPPRGGRRIASGSLTATLRLGQGQVLARAGQMQQAAAIAEDMSRKIGDMKNGLPGIDLLFLQALVHLGQGQYGPGSETLEKALAAQATASLRNFQIARASGLYDAGDISPRVATDLFKSMLNEPTPADWSQRSLDTLAVMSTPHDDAYDRWFLAALDRKDVPQAIEVSERSKRHRFLSTLPLGGRLLALRAILEAPDNELPTEAVMERQQLLANFPGYRDLSAAAAQLYQQLRDGPVIRTGRRRGANAQRSARGLEPERHRPREPGAGDGAEPGALDARLPAASHDRRIAENAGPGRGPHHLPRSGRQSVWLPAEQDRLARLAIGKRSAGRADGDRFASRTRQFRSKSRDGCRRLEGQQMARRSSQGVRSGV